MANSYGETTVLTAKERHRETLLGYLSNPENPFLCRADLATKVLGFSVGCVIYQSFTPAELEEIELEGLTMRRKRYSSKIAAVDDGLLKKAAAGDASAAKLVFQRYEQWSEKTKQEITMDGPILQQILAVFPPELADKVKLALIAKHRELM